MMHEESKHLFCRINALELAHKMNMYICADIYNRDEIYDLKNYKIETILIADIFTIKAYLDRCWKLRAFC
jgi:hypothetical protein